MDGLTAPIRPGDRNEETQFLHRVLVGLGYEIDQEELREGLHTEMRQAFLDLPNVRAFSEEAAALFGKRGLEGASARLRSVLLP